MTEVHLAVDVTNHLGETPIWSPSDQALWWVNCENPPALHRWAPDSGEHRTWPMPQRIGGFVPKADGGLLVVLADGVYDFDPDSGVIALRARSPLAPPVTLHECHCDRQGRLWVGGFDHDFPTVRNAKKASWLRLEGNSLIPVIEGIGVANGLAFSPDGRTLYCSDSPSGTVDAYDYDPENGDFSNRRLFLSLGQGEGFVDGATVDSEGGYWLAAIGAGALRRYWPDGTLDRVISLPFVSPTKPAFGGADMKTLFVTSSAIPIPPAIIPPGLQVTAPSGGVFALRPGETGIAETPLMG